MKEQIFDITSNRRIAENVYEMTLAGEVSEKINPGQFLNVTLPNRKDLILKRPFGIAAYDGHGLTFCYQTVGKGTEAMAELEAGVRVSVTYPLGNGFNPRGKKRIMLVGGGAGVFPLLAVAEHTKGEFYSFLGYASKSAAVYAEQFKAASVETFVATNDGSLGEKGFVTDIVRREIARVMPEIIFTCGPKPMYKALLSALTGFEDIPVFASLEERMGCGIGACLVCVCKIDGYGGLGHRRVCADGPVFNLREVVL